MNINTKDYQREYHKKYYENNKQRLKDYQKERRKILGIKPRRILTPEEILNRYLERKKYLKEYWKKNKQIAKEHSLENYRKNRDKWRARRISQSIKIPEDKFCELCNIRKATERHHKDYSKPYLVLFICKECHEKI